MRRLFWGEMNVRHRGLYGVLNLSGSYEIYFLNLVVALRMWIQLQPLESSWLTPWFLNDNLNKYATNSQTNKSTVIRHAIYAYLRQVHVLQLKHV